MKLQDKIYRGFIRCKVKDNKKQANEKYKREEVKDLPTWEDRKTCAYVAGVFEEPYGMIDFDNQADWEIVKKIIKELDLKLAYSNSKHGGHVYGKLPRYYINNKLKCVTKCYNAIGLFGDMKHGYTNAIDLVKRDDLIMYNMDYNNDLEDLDEIPKWLIVDPRYFELATRDEGGRDSVLHTRRGLLAKLGYTKDEILNVLNIINKFVFSSPMSSEEVNAKVTDEFIEGDKKNFKLFNNYTFLDNKGKSVEKPNEMVQYLVDKYHVCNYNDSMYFYYRDSYIDDIDLLISDVSDEFPTLPYNRIVEVIKLLNSKSKLNKKESNDLGYIKFKNGIVDLRTGELLNNTWKYFTTKYIPHKYKNTKSEFGEFFFNHVTNDDKDVQILLFQILGRCLWNRPIDSEAFIISGKGGNGKTTYLKMIEMALGEENFSPTEWQELGKGFATDDGRHALAITSDELDENTFSDTGFFFKLSSGGMIIGNAKYGKRGKYRFNALLLSACNELPKLRNLNLIIPLERRLTLIEFKKDLRKPENHVDNLNEEIKKESFIEWFLYQAVKQFRTVIETGKYIKPQDCIDNMKRYKYDIDKISVWLDTITKDDLIGLTSKDVTFRFRGWLNDETFPLKRGELSEYIFKKFALKLTVSNGNRVYK